MDEHKNFVINNKIISRNENKKCNSDSDSDDYGIKDKNEKLKNIKKKQVKYENPNTINLDSSDEEQKNRENNE